MRFDVITIFPGMFDAIARHGITSRALERGLWSLNCWNPRDYATDAYRSIDDRPYGGGPGMVMLAEPLSSALQAIRARQQRVGQWKAARSTLWARQRGRSVRQTVVGTQPLGQLLGVARCTRFLETDHRTAA